MADQATMWTAIVRLRQQRPEDAETLYKAALAMEDPNSADAATTMELYAQFLREQGRVEEAGALQDRATGLRKVQTVSPTPSATVHRIGGSVTAPGLLSKVEPSCTEEARAAKYQGTVVIYTEIGPDGLTHNPRVVRGLGLGLNEKAIDAISQWKFKPGSMDGQPVTVSATIEVNWRLL